MLTLFVVLLAAGLGALAFALAAFLRSFLAEHGAPRRPPADGRRRPPFPPADRRTP